MAYCLGLPIPSRYSNSDKQLMSLCESGVRYHLTQFEASPIMDFSYVSEERWSMSTALKMEVSPDTIIRAVKGMSKNARRAFLEDLLAATSPEYLQSIREARRDYKAGRVKSHAAVFGR